MTFKYFDSGSTSYKVCIDSDATCPFTSAASGSEQWRDGTFTIPPGTHTVAKHSSDVNSIKLFNRKKFFQVYFLACHATGATSYGGIDNVALASYGSVQNPCPTRRHL